MKGPALQFPVTSAVVALPSTPSITLIRGQLLTLWKGQHHDTAMVLFQDISSTPVGKPDVSTTGLERRSCKLKTKLPCQELKFHPKPKPDDFKVAEDDGLPLSDTAFQSAENKEFFISFVRCGQPDKASDLPCWGAFHALII